MISKLKVVDNFLKKLKFELLFCIMIVVVGAFIVYWELYNVCLMCFCGHLTGKHQMINELGNRGKNSRYWIVFLWALVFVVLKLLVC